MAREKAILGKGGLETPVLEASAERPARIAFL